MAETIDQAQRHAEAKAAAVVTLNSVGSTYDADLQSRAAILHAAGESIAQQELDVQAGTQELAGYNDEFQILIDSTLTSLGEFGDAQSFAELIEKELLVIEETLRLVEGRPETGNISGTGG